MLNAQCPVLNAQCSKPTALNIDNYFRRGDVPAVFDAGLYEVRLLTVIESARRSRVGFAVPTSKSR